MFKSQTTGRKLYSALGGKIGIITIIVIAIIIAIIIIIYIRKKVKDQMLENDDFLRYTKLIIKYLKTKREVSNYEETRVQFNLDRFEFTNVLLPVGDIDKNLLWDTDSSTFGDLCNDLIGMVSYGSDKNSKYYKNPLLWKQILFAIRTIAAKLPDSPQNFTVPWGDNWYQFSITYPMLIVSTAFSYYDTFGTEDAFLTRHLSSYINNYFKESKTVDGLYSMGWRRYESNVIGMSVPLIGGRLYSNKFDREANSQKYARDYMSVNYVYTGNGFYYDNTYITHVSRNDGYTTSFYHDFVFIYEFYRMNTKFFKVLHKNFSITEHPDIPLHHGPWFNRGASMKGFVAGRKFATYGIDIRGYERGVCVRTKDISLHYCGQILPLAAYESDRINKEWAQCWVFMRRPLTKKSAERLYTSLVPHYDGVHSYGLKQIDWPSVTTTTTTYEPSSALCSLCYMPDKAAGMYNKYKIKMANQYTFDIEEINLVTPQGFHVYYNCKVDTTLASSNPYTIACHLGDLDENQEGRLTGIGAKNSYAFDNFIGTFLYLDEIDNENSENVVKLEKILDPATSKQIDTLYVQPTQRQIFSFGFSNNFYEPNSLRRHNNLNSEPRIDQLSTDEFKLEKSNTDDALLFLHNLKEKTCAVSYAFNNTLPRGLRIKKNILDEKFEKYNIDGAIFESSSQEYTFNTYEKQFQIILTNVVLK